MGTRHNCRARGKFLDPAFLFELGQCISLRRVFFDRENRLHAMGYRAFQRYSNEFRVVKRKLSVDEGYLRIASRVISGGKRNLFFSRYFEYEGRDQSGGL